MTKNFRIFFIVLVLSLPFWLGVNLAQKDFENFLTAQISQPIEIISKSVANSEVQESPKPKLDMLVKSAVSLKINGENKKIIFQKDADQILPIASLTKLMTAVVVLDDPENYNFDKIVVISKNAVDQDENLGNLAVGEKISVKNLLHTMLIESSNDAAFALSEVIGKDNFVTKMNQKAIDLGLKDTFFINPTGLDIDDLQNKTTEFNYSTAIDLEKLSEYILNQYPQIWEISSEMSYEVLNSENQFHHLAVNRNGFSHISPDFETIGWKTGYTDTAGGCVIVVLKDSENNNFINVVLGAASVDARVEEMKKLVNYINS